MSVDGAGDLRFPTGFRWGAATSSYQIEGAPEADGKGESIWDRFCATPGTIVDGTSGALGVDHYNRWPADVSLMSDLGLGAYRFSIAWPRVVPDGDGAVNAAGLDFYDRLVDALLEAGIQPLPTLYHWDLPQALQDRGGWVSRHTAHAFADYAEAVVARLGDRIGTWMTLNEPFVSANHGYVTGEHAPGHTSWAEGFAASHHLLLGHGLALERLRAAAPDAHLGLVLNFTPATPGTDSEADRAQAQQINDLENRWYVEPVAGLGYPEETGRRLGWTQDEVLDGDLDLISAPIDVLGVNFYTRTVVFTEAPADDSWRGPVTDMGWEIHPRSLGDLLVGLHDRHRFARYMITENGAAMPDTVRRHGRVDDQDRIDYLRRHLAEVHRAIGAGVPVEGYMAWSLLDNFEWAHGFAKTFGLVEVDQVTLDRRAKASALWYAEVARTNTVTIEETGTIEEDES
ncbi:MAG: GH1 family beta-glucosidase [Acidimicrobiales bacterium]